MKRRSITAVLSLMAAAALLPPAPAAAQGFPEREISIYCGYPAGSGADVFVRYFAEALRPIAGKPVLVENKAGATGSLAGEAVARAKPDGHTLLITPGGAASYNVHLFKKLAYDPLKDLSPITTLIWFPFLLVVDPKNSATTVPGLVTHLKSRGDKASYGNSAATALAASEMFKTMAGVQAVQVAYRSATPALSDMKEGNIDFMFLDPAIAMEQARAGRVRALAVTTPQRSSVMPELPTMKEAGYPEFELTSWFAVFAPAGTPAPVIQRLLGWFHQILAAQATKDFFKLSGAETFPGTPEALRQRQISETEKWATIVRIANIQPQ